MHHNAREQHGGFPLQAPFRLLAVLGVGVLSALLPATKGWAQDIPPDYARGHVLVKFREGLNDHQRGLAIGSVRGNA